MERNMATIEELERRLEAIEARIGLRGAVGRIGSTLDEFNAKTRANPRRKWTDEEWADLMAIAGAGEGPEDLSVHMRRYLYGEND